MTQPVYSRLDEGFGGAYERIIFSRVVSNLARKYDCHNILELNATYIAGLPGFNSSLLAQQGYNVTVAVSQRDYPDTVHIWDSVGLKANIIPINGKLPFKPKEFDVVWNHLAFEQFAEPEVLVNQMQSYSSKLVINLILNPLNYGYWFHQLMHKLYREKWNHGYLKHCTLAALRKAHNNCGLTIIEEGACDAPPVMDTVNSVIGNSMTYADMGPKAIRNKWVWASINPECQKNKLVKKILKWEDEMPNWFRMVAAHHLYLASEVK